VPPALLRILGAPGAGKTLLITTLVEEFRGLGHFVATSAPRGDAATVITTSSGARITAERALTADELCSLVGSVDPRAALLLAESLDAPGLPAVEVLAPGAHPSTPPADLLATIPSTEVAPGATAPLATLIERRIIKGEPPEEPRRSILDRLLCR
jgi:molybdopterin-guanine dinucleotide biosynthesis protein